MRRLLLLAGLLVTLGLYAVYHDTELPLRPPGAPALQLEIPPGMRADGVGRELHRLGLVRHPALFRVYVWRRGSSGRLRAGSYSIEGGRSLREIVELLERGESTRREITFPEGRSIDQMALALAAAGLPAAAFRAAAADPQLVHDLDPQAKDLEGYLFPDTYDVGQGEGAGRALVRRMVQRFRSVIQPQRPLLEKSGLTLRQVVTLASLVELETAQAAERSRIAAVFLNRLKKGMLLQTDPTVIYALKRAGPYDGNIRKKDLDIDSPYNTYRYAGLPPGPIAAPGRGALRAVLEPAPVKDLYFVSRNDGTHEFSETLRQHEQAVDRYQRYRQRSVAARPRR